MAQLKIIGPVIYYSLRPGRVVEVARIDPATATKAREALGWHPIVAALVTHEGWQGAKEAIDYGTARQAGVERGLLVGETKQLDVDAQARDEVARRHLRDLFRRRVLPHRS